MQPTETTPLQRYLAECAERMETAYQACKAANRRLSAAVADHQPAAELSELEAAHEAARQAWYDTSRLYLQARDALVKFEGL